MDWILSDKWLSKSSKKWNLIFIWSNVVLTPNLKQSKKNQLKRTATKQQIFTNLVDVEFHLNPFGNWWHFFSILFHPFYDIIAFFIIPDFEVSLTNIPCKMPTHTLNHNSPQCSQEMSASIACILTVFFAGLHLSYICLRANSAYITV